MPDDYGGRSDWLEIDWSAHRHRIDVAGRALEYVDIGSGPPIVFIHGLGGSWQNWLENLPYFARTNRCIAMDLPGFGASEMPADAISIESFARWVDELLTKLGIDRAAVVGNSMGGFIGAELAIKFSTRVEKLVLVSAAVLWQEYRRAKPLVALAKRTEATVGRSLAKNAPRAAMRPRVRHILLAFGGFRYPHKVPPELQVELIRTARRTPGFVPALEALSNYPLREELSKVQAPTLITWGAQDTLVGVRHADELERLIPNARKVIFERTGHVQMLERPERFNRVVGEFLGAPAPTADPPTAVSA
jgi:4,5:9,10-diseco-3-hydroxy-5,9,17-trioxoandrosta-1(10),2-diene-4-oate hydrolase